MLAKHTLGCGLAGHAAGTRALRSKVVPAAHHSGNKVRHMSCCCCGAPLYGLELEPCHVTALSRCHLQDHFAELAVDAITRLKGSGNLEAIHIIKKAGGALKVHSAAAAAAVGMLGLGGIVLLLLRACIA
jgi:hypothetical protein